MNGTYYLKLIVTVVFQESIFHMVRLEFVGQYVWKAAIARFHIDGRQGIVLSNNLVAEATAAFRIPLENASPLLRKVEVNRKEVKSLCSRRLELRILVDFVVVLLPCQN